MKYIALIILAMTANLSWAAAIGNIVDVRGDVDVLRNGKILKVEKTPFLLKQEDIVVTSFKAVASLHMKDAADYRIGPSSQFAFERYGKKVKREASFALNLLRGSVELDLSGNDVAHDRIVLTTPNSKINVLGDSVMVRYCQIACSELTGTSIAVISGEAELISDETKAVMLTGEFAALSLSDRKPVFKDLPKNYLDIEMVPGAVVKKEAESSDYFTSANHDFGLMFN